MCKLQIFSKVCKTRKNRVFRRTNFAVENTPATTLTDVKTEKVFHSRKCLFFSSQLWSWVNLLNRFGAVILNEDERSESQLKNL